ncbi:MAG: type I-Fv CRISPR-associated protein Cas5fv [Acinetobacter sp.]|nr:type I-Fv CRISPR-associated protein Cas5fv [Acinetobacter sp.]
MRIKICYEASWRNSFLDGSNDEPLPKKGRNFIASIEELKKVENFHQRNVTHNTVMGILCRLIGDQRKLYQTRQSADYYFKNLEDSISFCDTPTVISQEIAYIRNMKLNDDKNSFTGMIKVNDPIFLSDYSAQFWGVLNLTLEELCDFILDENYTFQTSDEFKLNPIDILNKLESIKKLKPIAYENQIKQASDVLVNHFTDYKPLNAKQLQLILPMYCSALYLQMKRLEQKGYDMNTAKSPQGLISGISKNGFTPKDFMGKYTTGGKKLIYGNPYFRKEFIKGEGEIKHTLTKASGQLEITLDISTEQAKELRAMIDAAGVSSFYLGKKGLAYVDEIRLS